jgi:methylmalonyl-CoA mutase
MVGEISYALEKVFGRHRADRSVMLGAYSTAVGAGGDEEMEKVRKQVRTFGESVGRNPRILVAKVSTSGGSLVGLGLGAWGKSI